MNLLVIYAHPSDESVTFLAKEAFVKGAKAAGHCVEIYQIGLKVKNWNLKIHFTVLKRNYC